MTDTENTTTDAAAASDDTATGAGAADQGATTDGASTTETSASTAAIWDDPVTAKAEIEKLRRENGAARTNAKAQAADQARTELAQTIGKALGLIQDETQQIDPAELTQQLTASQREARQARVALAVYQNAGAAGADAGALLDSATFLRSVEQIDPTDAAAVSGAIAQAVENNPRLAAITGTRTPAPNPAQGAATKAPTPQELADQAAAGGDFKKAAALKADQLLALNKNSV